MFLISATSLASAQGSEARASADEPLELVMDQAPLDDVVKAIAERTGADYLFEPPLPGRVTIAVPARVSAAEATEILHAALLLKGFVALPMAPGRFKIVRWEKMAGSAPYTEAPLSPEDEHAVTTRIVLHHANPEEVARTLRPLVQASGQIIPYAPAGSLILAGTANRVHRLIGIARHMDSAQHERLIVRRLRYRNAAEVHGQLKELLSRSAQKTKRSSEVKLVVDARTNALLLSGPDSELKRVREWIEVIDVPAPGSGELHVVNLIHQDPEAIAALLGAQQGGGSTSSNSEQARSNSGPLLGHDYTVVTHPSTRSLVIRSDRETFGVLSQLIAKLDRESRMVRVDVNIFEISTNGRLGLGVGGVIPIIEPEELDDTALIALVNPIVLPFAIPGVDIPGAGSGVLGPPLLNISGENVIIPVLDSSGQPTFDPDGTPAVIVVPGLGITMVANNTQADIKLEQQPSLVIAVGEESEIFVGDNVPVPVGSTDDLSSINGPAIRLDIQREDVGTRLRVKPLLSNDGNLQLELQIENQLLTGLIPEAGPVIATRTIDTSFSADFDKRIVIAGLNSETAGMIETSVPFLSSIPVIGQLFTAKLERVRKTYFVVTVQAHLIPTTEEKQATNEALTRAIAQIAPELLSQPDTKYALRVASYYERETAEISLSELDVSPWPTVIVGRATEDGDRHDIYVVGFHLLTEVAKMSLHLNSEGFLSEIVSLTGEPSTVR
jgi:general secretion pathway protein D